MTGVTTVLARSEDEIAAAIKLGWSFFDLVRRETEVGDRVDDYLRDHNVAEKYANFADHFLPPHGDCILALNASKVPVGAVLLTRKGDGLCEMNRMIVGAAVRGLGAGRALCAAVIARAREMGFRTMQLDTIRSLKAAIALYSSAGFVLDTSPARYGSDEDFIINMIMDLTSNPAEVAAS